MRTVVGVRFKRAGKIYYFDPRELQARTDDDVIVETARGLEYGRIVVGPRRVRSKEVTQPLKPIIRIATDNDTLQWEKNREREISAAAICREKIRAHRLPMKLITAEYTFDLKKVVFFFTADGRIDFRELVRDLVSTFRTRIELRQVGVRDEAKELNGIGPCGRPLCCANWMAEFDSVSIRMAKTQGLSLNPAKVSGLCGRLMCCLRYENDQYKKGGDLCKDCACPHKKERQAAPQVGQQIKVNGEIGTISFVNTNKRTVQVQLSDQQLYEMTWTELEKRE